MQKRREKYRLLKFAVCSKICSAMQFITCPSETRGHWLTERRNMSESWSWNVISPHISSLKLRILQSVATFNENMVKRNRTVFKKRYCENSRLVVLAVLTPPSPFDSWAFPSRSWCSPPFPILSVPISKWTQLMLQARLSSHLLQGWSSQPQVRTMTPGDSHPCVPTSGSWGLSWLSSHVKWTHVIECTRLSHCCCQHEQFKELEHPWIRIQIRNFVFTRAFFCFKNTKFELKIFRVKKPTIWYASYILKVQLNSK